MHQTVAGALDRKSALTSFVCMTRRGSGRSAKAKSLVSLEEENTLNASENLKFASEVKEQNGLMEEPASDEYKSEAMKILSTLVPAAIPPVAKLADQPLKPNQSIEFSSNAVFLSKTEDNCMLADLNLQANDQNQCGVFKECGKFTSEVVGGALIVSGLNEPVEDKPASVEALIKPTEESIEDQPVAESIEDRTLGDSCAEGEISTDFREKEMPTEPKEEPAICSREEIETTEVSCREQAIEPKEDAASEAKGQSADCKEQSLVDTNESLPIDAVQTSKDPLDKLPIGPIESSLPESETQIDLASNNGSKETPVVSVPYSPNPRVANILRERHLNTPKPQPESSARSSDSPLRKSARKAAALKEKVVTPIAKPMTLSKKSATPARGLTTPTRKKATPTKAIVPTKNSAIKGNQQASVLAGKNSKSTLSNMTTANNKAQKQATSQQKNPVVVVPKEFSFHTTKRALERQAKDLAQPAPKKPLSNNPSQPAAVSKPKTPLPISKSPYSHVKARLAARREAITRSQQPTVR